MNFQSKKVLVFDKAEDPALRSRSDALASAKGSLFHFNPMTGHYEPRGEAALYLVELGEFACMIATV